MAVLFAALAAIGFAAAAVSSKRGVQEMSTLAGYVISLPAGLGVAVVIAAFDVPDMIPARALGLLALAGLLGSGVGRVLVIAGLRRLDTSVYVPLQTSVHPLVGVVGGLIMFGERITPLRTVGAAAVVGGVWILTRVRSAPALIDDMGAPKPPPRKRAPAGYALLLPIAAGLAFGGGDVTTKQAMLVMPHATFGAAVAILAACVAWTVLLAASARLRSQIRFGPGKRWFVAYGVVSTLAIMCAYEALERGDVSVVSPIIAAQPFAVLLLSAVFLRRIEVVSPRAVGGAALVVVGAVLVGVS